MDASNKSIDALPDCAVLNIVQVINLTGLSRDTLVRLHRQNEGPPRVQLSERRYGYPFGALRAWLTQRTEKRMEITAA
jgi:predicted DNA-binding transcriptional regulator AlpA